MCLRARWLIGAFLGAPLLAQTPAGAGYIDASACAACHSDIAALYSRTGMGRSFRSAANGVSLPEFEVAAFAHGESGQLFRFARRGESNVVSREAPGRYVRDVAVDYVIGSGDHARSYLHRSPDGKLVQFPVTWYAEAGGHWAMSPGYDRPGHQGFSRETPYRCMFCHNAYPEVDRRAAKWDGGTVFPNKLPEGIDCQRCHGPGKRHVDTARSGAAAESVRTAIVNPARLEPARQMEICMQCHLESTSAPLPAPLMRSGRSVFSYQAGEPLGDFLLFFDHAPGAGHDDKFEIVSAAYRFRKSACFASSSERLLCTTCHDPHRAAAREETEQKTERVCRNCHGSSFVQRVQAGGHPEARSCVGCHMPKRPADDVIHVTVTDHRIQRKPSPDSFAANRKEALPPPYAGEVVLSYPAVPSAGSDAGILRAVAQVKRLANVPAGFDMLEGLLRDTRPPMARAYYEMAEASFTAGRVGRSAPYYQEAIKCEPDEWRYWFGLGRSLQGSGEPTRAVSAYERARALSGDPVTLLLAIADTYLGQGNLGAAAAAARDAIGRNRESAAAHAKLGHTLLRRGDMEGAERALREAVRLGPEAGSIRVNLADALIRLGKLDDARQELEWALLSGPSVEEAQGAWFRDMAKTGDAQEATSQYQASLRSQMTAPHVNLGTVLMMQGDLDRAINHYRLAVNADPESSVALTNLGLALIQSGEAAEARRCLEKAVRNSPNLFEAHLHLGELLLTLGDAAAATTHLKRAAESPDAKVRKIANDLARRK